MNRFDWTRIIRTAAFGAVAGFLSFVIQEPRARALELAHMGDPSAHAVRDAFAGAMLMFSLLGLLITGAIVLSDELGSMSPKRVLTRFAIGLAAGAGCGALAGLIGQGVFSVVMGAGLRDISSLIFARTVGWAAVGAGTGLAAGLPSWSARKCLQGMVGGLIGGGIAGGLFDVVSIPFASGTASRMIGDMAIGACVGAAVMAVEEAAKVAWVTVVLGRNEGRQYILSKPVTGIGRDELSDVPLYGDMQVAKQHATIRTLDWRGFTFHDLGSPGGSGINGLRVAEKPLVDGDRIQIGSFQLLFSHRAGAASVYQQQYVPPPTQAFQAQNQSLCPFCGQYRDPATGTCGCVPIASSPGAPVIGPVRLVGVAGPYTSVVFQLDGDRIEIGRDPSNTIVLDQDAGVSRKHAFITRESGRFVLHDAGSTNGAYVNGNRVQSVALNPGDVVHLGGSSFQFGA